jgi:hypothetical protein
MSDWHAIVVDGGERATRGFIAGFVGDRGVAPTKVLLAEDLGVTPESLGERIVELLTGGRHQVVLVVEELAAAFVDALERGGPAARLAMAEHHRVAGASFGFTVETFSRDVAKQVRAALGSLPTGVTIGDLDERAETHPDEKGVELYAPGHEYTYRAHGRVAGTLDGVGAVRRKLEQIEVVQLEPVHLDAAR